MNRRFLANLQVYPERVITVLLALLVTVLACRGTGGSPKGSRHVAVTPAPGKVLVQVSGVVENPGVYSVPDNIMSESVIKMADSFLSDKINAKSGCCSKVALEGASIAASLDQYGRPVLTHASMSVKQKLVLEIPLDINMLTLDDFVLLPGIGQGLAKNIIAYRQSIGGFSACSELKNVPGIGVSKLLKLNRFFKCK